MIFQNGRSDILEHLKGWRLSSGDPHMIMDGRSERIATVQCGGITGRSFDQATDIAALMAAAPELLEVLQYAVSKYGKEGGPWNVPSDPGGWLERARAAIKKAKGEVK